MERKIMKDLIKWKNDVNRKPLLIYGNKQNCKKVIKKLNNIDTFYESNLEL